MKQNYRAFLIMLLFMLPWGIHAQWTIIETPTENSLVGIHFYEPSTGIAVGSNGTILKTSDSGDTWVSTFTGSDDFIRVQIIDQIAYAISDQGFVYKSDDKGDTWNSVAYLGHNLRSIHFLNDSVGYVGAVGGTIFKTINGGQSWSSTSTGTGKTIRYFHFKNQLEGFVVGDDGIFFKTDNGGTSWLPITLNTAESLFCIYFFDETTGYITGTNGTVFKTVTGGATWQSMNFPITTQLRTIFFTSINEGYTIGNAGFIFHTQDGGISWETNSTVTSNTLYQIHFTSDGIGFISGQNGTILRLKEVVNSVEDSSLEKETIDIFPNPAGQQFTIKFKNGAHPFHSLKVYNLEGRLLIQKNVDGLNKVELGLNNFSSGMYILKIEDSSGNSVSKKLVVEKSAIIP